MSWQRKGAQERAGYALPACLIILDGFGMAEAGPGNAISLARTPVLDEVLGTRPLTLLDASGAAVGLPAGQMGNSEVGHLNIGAGRVVHQELSRINRACEQGELASNEALCAAFAAVRDAAGSDAVLHLMGLVSDGGVHSSIEHLLALVAEARRQGVRQVRVHCFMDGRDVDPRSGAGFIRRLEDELASLNGEGFDARIASIAGRYYAMDRDNRWERVERAWKAIVRADPLVGSDAAQVVAASYERDVTDEFIEPVALDDRGVRTGDAVVFFNFRPDRARQLSYAFASDDFTGFERPGRPAVSFVCLTEYDPCLQVPVAFPKTFPDNVLADVLSAEGLAQFHIAETEKYAHVTFFLNGGREQPKPGEQRKLVASPKVATYDLRPQMSAPEVAHELAAAIDRGEADAYIVNFANCDMVGHTGVIEAATAAVEAVDAAVGEVLAAVQRAGGLALLTADHGNADQMIAPSGGPMTAHTTALVPFALIDYGQRGLGLRDEVGALCNVAPTLLDAMGVPRPAEMTATSLLTRQA
ncbi:2,3-bisphosphoglycerate-independent phosphoglycerate mutase [Eggerthellaceae bacterium zg-997]|nr:2,3-bisphosphoglycerate-independent phosphoglycerate mutase [Eggerthellaceae bacterium zg-997]